MASTSWDELSYKLQPWIRDAMISLGFSQMTPVQASTIPLLSAHKDVVVQAVTGSGKTLAFVIPVLEKICHTLSEDGVVKRGRFGAVIVSPTRELASQINTVLESILEYEPEDLPAIKTQLLVGSVQTLQEDVQAFLIDKPQILVGTPGRIYEFLQTNSVKTNSCEILVFDEADKLLDTSFINTTEAIVNILPRQRRTGLFSATISSAGNDVFKTRMTNPVKITVKSSSLSSSVPQSLGLCYMTLNPAQKLKVLLRLLTDYRYRKTIVYFPTCIGVSYFYTLFRKLMKNEPEITLVSLHGKLQPKPRLRAITSFAESTAKKTVLFTTDVAARGLDFPEVDLVIQVDPPTDPDMFLHRCGRTGRANKVGKAITMLSEGREEEYVGFMKVKGVELKPIDPPEVKPEYEKWYDDTFKQWLLQDRQRYDLAVRSYVGYVRYYSKHVASSIFRIRTLDYKGTARMYGLTRLPKMPENKYVEDFPPDGFLDQSIDFDKYAYVDKKKEEARLHELRTHEKRKERQQKAQRRREAKEKNVAWSGKSEKKETKAERREKSKRRRDAVEASKEVVESDSDSADEEDWKETVLENKRRKKSRTEVQGSFADL